MNKKQKSDKDDIDQVLEPKIGREPMLGEYLRAVCSGSLAGSMSREVAAIRPSDDTRSLVITFSDGTRSFFGRGQKVKPEDDELIIVTRIRLTVPEADGMHAKIRTSAVANTPTTSALADTFANMVRAMLSGVLGDAAAAFREKLAGGRK